MSIEASMKGVTSFLDDNNKLIDDIRGTAENASDVLKNLFEKLESNRTQTEELVSQINTLGFSIAADSEVKAIQKQLIESIREKSAQIEQLQDKPTLVAALLGERAQLQFDLGKTFIRQTVQKLVQFSPEEVTELRGLLEKATLDAQKRQQKADILAAAVEISQLALKVAVKLAV